MSTEWQQRPHLSCQVAQPHGRRQRHHCPLRISTFDFRCRHGHRRKHSLAVIAASSIREALQEVRAFAGMQSQSLQHAACGGAWRSRVGSSGARSCWRTQTTTQGWQARAGPPRAAPTGTPPAARSGAAPTGTCKDGPYIYVYICVYVYKATLARLLGSRAVQDLATAKVIMDLATSSLDRRARTALRNCTHKALHSG